MASEEGAYHLGEEGASHLGEEGASHLGEEGAYHLGEEGASHLGEEEAYHLDEEGAYQLGEKGADHRGHPSGLKPYTGGIRTTTQFHNGITTVQYPFPNGRTYVFYWDSAGELAYLNGNKIEGGANNYSGRSIRVKSVSIKNNSKNAPLASALTSNGLIHIFYPDPDDRTLSEAIFNPLTLKWSTGSLSVLRLKVHPQSGIGAWSEPILKVVLHTNVHPQRVTEAWWNTLTSQWESIVIS